MERLKSLIINQKGFCTLKIGSMPDKGIFRYIREFTVKIEKKEDTTSFSLITLHPPTYKFTVYLRNLCEIIQSSPMIYYIVMASRPALYQEVELMGQAKWQQEDLRIFNEEDDYI